MRGNCPVLRNQAGNMDPIADMFTKIRNAYAVEKDSVSVPYSKFKLEVAKVLRKEGYVKEINRKGKKTKKNLDIVLLYKNGKPALEQVIKISKPSRRVYVSSQDIHPVKRGHGVGILSTPKGVLTDKEARKQKIGGELIAKVW